ncbi:MAG: hypothetical protein CMI53_02605 [Parcubacteria group bacterium]|nr:hypothetical protein [Parcubacteria group bacterium]
MTNETNGPSAAEMGLDGAESKEDRELNEYGAQMEDALADLMVSKAQSENDLREALKDSLIISRGFDAVLLTDNKNLLDLEGVKDGVNPLIEKHGLDPKKFSIDKFSELAKASD